MESENLVHDYATIMIENGLAEARAAMVFFENGKTNGILVWEEMVGICPLDLLPHIAMLALTFKDPDGKKMEAALSTIVPASQW